MKKIISILFAASLFLASCSKDNNDVYYYDMYLAIEIVDNQGNDLLGESSSLIHQGETKARIGKDYYLDTHQEDDRFTFRHIQQKTHNYIKRGCWFGDCTDYKITIDWGADIEKDLIVFSYDCPLNGSSPKHDFRYPYSITINGKNLELNEDSGHFIYVKDIE